MLTVGAALAFVLVICRDSKFEFEFESEFSDVASRSLSFPSSSSARATFALLAYAGGGPPTPPDSARVLSYVGSVLVELPLRWGLGCGGRGKVGLRWTTLILLLCWFIWASTSRSVALMEDEDEVAERWA